MDETISFGYWLRRRRKALDLTQEQFAQQVGCSPKTIQKLEAVERRPSLAMAERLADVLALAPTERTIFLKVARSELVADRLQSGLVAGIPSLLPLEHRHPCSSLPAQMTALIGRSREVAEICVQLGRRDVRLLTLTGPGGIGKTRLALQAAVELQGDFADGIVFVTLVPVTDPAFVIPAVAHALGVQESSGQPLLESLKVRLRTKRLLLVLDNFEHVIEEAPVVAELLSAAPYLKVLVTSREVLRLYGEREFPVPPLTLPDLQHLPALPDLSQYDAVRLFVERAQAVQPDFAIADGTAPVIAAICHRLDGLPLAIELAAARIRLFSPQAMLQRLDRPLKILTSGGRDLPGRHQTLRATIDWSYNLLPVDEQRLFARLAVFVGGWTLEAAETVVTGQRPLSSGQEAPEIQHPAVSNGIEALVAKSLVRRQLVGIRGTDGMPRFDMLETIREYALERLEANGEVETVRRQHAAYYLILVELAEPELEGAGQIGWLQHLEADHDNLRAAFAWSCATPGTTELSLRLTGALYGFWWRHHHLSEASAWLERALARPGGPAAARTRALFTLAQLADRLHNYGWAITLYRESLAMFQSLDDHVGVARVLLNQGRTAHRLGDYEQACTLEEESLTRFRDLEDRAGVSMALLSLGDVALDQGDVGRARGCLEEGKRISRELGLTAREAGATLSLAFAARAAGDDVQAVRLLAESLALFGVVGDPWYASGLLLERGRMAHAQGDDQWAAVLYREGLVPLGEVGSTATICECLEGLAGTVVSTGQATRAVRLFGAAAALRASVRVSPALQGGALHDLDTTRGHLSEGAWNLAWAEGQAMSLEQAIAYALEDRHSI